MPKFKITVIPDDAIKFIEIELDDERDIIELDELDVLIDNNTFYKIKEQMDSKYFTIISSAEKIKE